MFTLQCKGRLISLAKPIVMGIINITPDSFYPGSRELNASSLIEKAGQMISAGATILDIGAQSTRPGSELLPAEVEWNRLSILLPTLVQTYPDTVFSIDTFHAEVASRAVNAGASMVNDISAGRLDPLMISTVASLHVPFVCMHSKGSPQTMQSMASYENLLLEMTDYFIEHIALCRKAGIKDIVLDPGIGFAKTIEHNFEIIRQLRLFTSLKLPLLLGVSRKSMIATTLGVPVEETLNGTTVLNTVGIANGASILRVHDVKEAMQVIQLMST